MTPAPDPATDLSTASESAPGCHLGRRIAACRIELGLTQQGLAARIAISRVALSNLESGRSVPGERTVTLLAGIFGMEPWDLVEGTNYPGAKVDRLPLVTARHTEVELQLALLQRDLTWLESAPAGMARQVVDRWRSELGALERATADPAQRAKVRAALDDLR
ncbi:MAG: helix-turn-helix domain-containing protein [Actinomycetota bacterium]|nr:helix-turn-helix domain-containing protein [Actinomycetota bacterium]